MKRPPALPHPFRRLPHRIEVAEILDDAEGVSIQALTRSLGAMTKVNSRLGGVRSLLRHLRPLARSLGRRSLSLLDMGVGSGALPRAVARALANEGVEVEWTGVDRELPVLGVARRDPGEANRELVCGDALALPFPAKSFDVVISSLTLHHFGDEEARLALEEAARVARMAVFISDLERHPLHYLGARLLARSWWRNDPITSHDGPASVLRAFTRAELESLARDLSFRRVQVHRHLPFRIVLEGIPA
jgi:ubiquinone/menaquinone biosynthesis C-methylase UbiE